MITHELKIILFVFACFLLPYTTSYAQENMDERHIKVSMRMIGHQVLLGLGDSTSRVLPIEKEKDRYSIQFETEFQFNPEELVTIIDRVVKDTKIANAYLVEVVTCERDKVIYSFEIGNEGKLDLIPCNMRIQPEACYSLLFTILDANNSLAATATLDPSNGISTEPEQSNYFTIALLIIPLLLLIGLFLSFWKKKRKSNADPNLIFMGEFQFDKRNMEISYENEIIKLTSKEADLLFLLHTSVNNTVEREVILKTVWGDEGDYVGRTLDVFISKLRKKLEPDSSLKIVNVRGIGYKFVMNDLI